MSSDPEPECTLTLRPLLLAIVLLGLAGTGVELLLLGHTDGISQLAPVILTGVAILAVLWQFLGPDTRSLRTLQVVMLLCVVAGLTGIVLHYLGNREFELETYPELAGWALFRETMTGATPALAPAAMMHLGLLGLLYTFRHPLLARKGQASTSPMEH